jgi:5-methylcytosine-specific restriction endonuclease McrBC regulatory subunit McrC
MTYGYIDTDKVRELANDGLCPRKIADILGHSRTGIYLHSLRHDIVINNNGRSKIIIVDGIETELNKACENAGFTREAMYQYRVNRGLDIQDGFNAYVLYMNTKTPTATIKSKMIMLLFRHKMQPIQTIKSVLGFGEGFLMFMRQNKYKQQAFDRYLYMRGIK